MTSPPDLRSAPAKDPAAERAPRRRAALLGVGLVGASAVLLGIGPAGAFDQVPGPWQRDAASTTDAGPDAVADTGDGCEPASDTAPPAPVVPPSTAGPQVAMTITVEVPPTIRVHSVGPDGLRVVSNAGRPPAPGDRVYVEGPDGSWGLADDELVSRVMTARWEDASWCSTTAVHQAG